MIHARHLRLSLFALLFPFVGYCLFLGLLVGTTPARGGSVADAWALQTSPEMQRGWSLVSLAWAFFYGVLRSIRFHPAIDSRYLGWLRATPWRRGLALPLGPVCLTWLDAVTLGVLTAGIVSWSHVHPALPIVLFGAGYALALSLTFGLGERKRTPLCLVVGGLAVAVWFWPTPWAMLAVVAVCVAVAMRGLHHSLGRFPWEEAPPSKLAGLGWPHNGVGPVLEVWGVTQGAGLLIGALASLWVYGIATRCDMTAADWRDNQAGFAALSCLLGVIRLCVYVTSHRPPIGWWGRLATGRWIIVGYDKVFIAPLCVAALGIALPYDLPELGCGRAETLAITTLLVLLATFNLGPTRRSWDLTGMHRITAPTSLDLTQGPNRAGIPGAPPRTLGPQTR